VAADTHPSGHRRYYGTRCKHLRSVDLVDSAISWLRPTLRFVRGTASMYARNTVMGSHTSQTPLRRGED
jgi:hypothetical protein